MEPIEHVYSGNAKEVKKDGRFITYKGGTVWDSITKLTWAMEDNGDDINWKNAKNYCENYRGGGYSDWRMPTQTELISLYDASKKNQHGACVTELIEITAWWVWASETYGSEAAYLNFYVGFLGRTLQSDGHFMIRALPVRSVK